MTAYASLFQRELRPATRTQGKAMMTRAAPALSGNLQAVLALLRGRRFKSHEHIGAVQLCVQNRATPSEQPVFPNQTSPALTSTYPTPSIAKLPATHFEMRRREAILSIISPRADKANVSSNHSRFARTSSFNRPAQLLPILKQTGTRLLETANIPEPSAPPYTIDLSRPPPPAPRTASGSEAAPRR